MKNKLDLLITDHSFSTFKSTQLVPRSPNALALSKWYCTEVLNATDFLDKLEKKHNTLNCCQSGCSNCCKQLITVSSSELIIISHAMRNFSVEEKAVVNERIEKACKLLSEVGITLNSIMQTVSLESQHEMQEKYFQLNLKCPFLNCSDTCMVYPIRPIACWFYRNYGNALECAQSWDAPNAIHYDYVATYVEKRLWEAKRPKGMYVLQLGIKNMQQIIG